MRSRQGHRTGISAVYARTALADQRVLAWQIGYCTAYCRSRGWMRVLTYADNGCPDSKLSGRWQLIQLMEDAKAGLVERLVVEDMQRLAKLPSQLNWIVAQFRGYRVAIHSVDNNEPRLMQ
jgi:DNA invertase Pin-like site-specific DNA recombinase